MSWTKGALQYVVTLKSVCISGEGQKNLDVIPHVKKSQGTVSLQGPPLISALGV